MREVLKKVFKELDERITAENFERQETGALKIAKAEIIILGQISLLAQPELTMQLDLAATGDLDAKMECDYFVKAELEKILPKYKLTYDHDSGLIFIPKSSQFHQLGEYVNLSVKVIDPESALVSKAVKAPEKNKYLIRSALASKNFSCLADRILEEGGKLEDFV